jgi:peptide deformylase
LLSEFTPLILCHSELIPEGMLPNGRNKAMTVLTILKYPDTRLNKVAKPVAVVDDRVRQLVRDMTETMYEAPGIGLAATQVDVHERIIVIDTSEEKNQLLVFINPEIVGQSEDTKIFDEGCLSVPGIYEDVERPDRVRVKALDENGQSFTKDCDGLLAVCIQHEIDHLDGKVFVQYLSRLKQNRIRTKMLKTDRKDDRKVA